MIPSAARVLEHLFGAILGPGAAVLRGIALLALAGLIGKSIAQTIQGIRARRHGPESASVAHCGTCGGFAADPGDPSCPAGHAVPFPARAAAREHRRRDRLAARTRPGRRLIGTVGGSTFVFLAALTGARAARIFDFHAPALAAAAGASAFLFLAAALALALRTVSPGSRTTADRVVSFFAGGVLLAPALIFLALCRTADPPPPRAIGSLWATPNACYAAPPGGRGRRIASPAAPSLEVEVVTSRSALFSWSWCGVSRFSPSSVGVPWSGSGGTRARLLAHLPARALDPLLSVELRRTRVDTPPNVRIWIVRSGDTITFEPEKNTAPEFDALRP